MNESQEPNPTVDFVAGTIGGAASLMVGFPFDTVKVRFQNPEFAQRYSSTMNAFTTIVREERFVGLFKGITSPLAAVALMNGLVFASYRFLLSIQLDNSSSMPTMSQIALAGAGCGVVSSIITTPTELIKIRQQSLVTPTSAKQVAWDIFKRSGVRGLYRGGTSTILRDSGYGAYFWAYEATCRYLNSRASSTARSSETSLVVHEFDHQPNVSSWTTLLTAGAVAGVAGWMFTFPFDVVKTRIQGTESPHLTQSASIRPLLTSSPASHLGLSQMYSTKATPSSHHPYRTTWSTIVNSYRSEGMPVFFRGLSPTLIRAIPVNMATFATFEAVAHALS
ncbi:MAG: carnitine/acyl carnitine carrier [Lentinula lateritia]|uniref:Carnitine/acyl carnitine carrier n=1 Tax=Lentinula lateritia TaxID=40482 RepID=A0ABQ8VD92_9AGAR|nr:MAG: carnitine/acyl carnitine carrier [Lentinula lateritia]KAJ4489115.1 carnitine/acyl carnitine carrier [Lentinula lateritia]